MKKISTRILALLAAMTMLLAGCSESDSSGSDSKKTESSSQSQTESSSDADSSDSADEGDDSTAGADVPDVIPWDYDVPDPSGNTKPQEDSSQSSSDSSSQSSSDSSHKQSENTTAAPAATTAKRQTTAAAPRQTTAAPKATTKAATAAPKPTPAPSGTPVQRHGALHISGNHIVLHQLQCVASIETQDLRRKILRLYKGTRGKEPLRENGEALNEVKFDK